MGIFCGIMSSIIKKLENERPQVFRSVEKVLPVDIGELKRSLRERGRILASAEEVEARYASDVVFRSMMYRQGWALTAQIGIDNMEYRRLSREELVNYRISRDAFAVLSPQERSVRLPGNGIVLASNAYFEDNYSCLILRADITRYRPVSYLYTIDKERKSRATTLAEVLRRL